MKSLFNGSHLSGQPRTRWAGPVLLALLLAAFAVSARAAGGVLFYPGQQFAVNPIPEAVVSADLDGDGNLDLATGNNIGNGIPTVSVLLSNGDGTFAPQVTYGTWSLPTIGLTAGDLDGDHDLDLVVTTTLNSATAAVVVLRNQGNGTFAAPVTYPVPYFATSTAIGDVDRDGDADLAVAGYDLTILKNNGNGTFGAPAAQIVDLSLTQSIVLRDLDGDGDNDVALADFDHSSALVRLNNGSGVFSSGVRYAVASGPNGITAGDLDGDGDIDLATANRASSMSVLRNNGNATFSAAVSYAAGPEPHSVAMGDLDRDGDLDLAVSNVTFGNIIGNNVSVYRNLGGGAFTDQAVYGVGQYPISVTIGDFDRDGDGDVATANALGDTVSVMLSNGDGTLANEAFYPGSTWQAVGDVTGDGAPDLLLVFNGSGINTGTVRVFPNNGWGAFGAPVTTPAGTFPLFGTVGDLNGDGLGDVVLVHTDGISVLRSTGGGNFAARVFYSMFGARPFAVLADLDGDGDRDVVVGKQLTDGIAVFRNDGAGNLTSFAAGATQSNPVSIAVGDLDGDGDADVATANQDSNSVSVLRNNGNGTFAPQVAYTVGSSPRSVVMADLDGDGDRDLAVANQGVLGTPDNRVSILRNNGNGTFAAQVTYQVRLGPAAIAAGDADGDGDIDLAVTNVGSVSGAQYTAGSTISVLLNNGNATFGEQTFYNAGTEPVQLAMLDLDRDGDLDLVARNQRGANVGVLLSPRLSPPLATLTPNPTTVTIGSTLSVSWTAPPGSGYWDWIGLFKVGDPNSGEVWYGYTGGATSGAFTLSSPNSPGTYEFRYLPNNGRTDVARSAPVTVKTQPSSSYTLVSSVPNGGSITAGSPLTVNWTAPAGSPVWDWIGLFPVGAASTGEVWWNYTWGATSGGYTLPAPLMPGQYEFRYLLNNGRLRAVQLSGA